jgi:hypothetical protein
MCELLRIPSSSISGPENPISKLLNPNSSIGGLPLHNNTTSLFTQSPLPFQSSLPQSYKSDNLPSTSCTTPSKPLCGTKADTLTGLSTDNTLVGTYEKPSIDQKSVAQSGKSNKTETAKSLALDLIVIVVIARTPRTHPLQLFLLLNL